MSPDAEGLSTAALCFLFADQLDGFQASGKGSTSPSGARFHAGSFAVVAWALTIQHLHQVGALEMEPTRRRRYGKKFASLELRATARPPHAARGLDEVVLARAAEPVTVHRVVYRWIGYLMPKFYAKTIRVAQEEALAAGLGRSESAPTRLLRRREKDITWDREAVRACWPAFEDRHDRWLAFRTEFPDRAEVLLDEIRKAHEDHESSS